MDAFAERQQRPSGAGAASGDRSSRPSAIVPRRSPAVQPPRPHLGAEAARPAYAAGEQLWPAPVDWVRISEREREVYELGFMTGYFLREDEVEQASADADRYYRAAFDRPARRR